MSDLASQTSEQDDYDLLPYPSMPYAYTQPARLAAVAALHGLAAPDAGRARVLELGCAAGGNIIPLAARLPHAHFVGVDIVRRHIEDARARVAQLGLANVSFEQADLTTLAGDGAPFDYVICHGVFSWVPAAVQDAILRVCQSMLSPNGLAMISYNVLPGWHLRSIIRDICLRHVGVEGPPMQRVAKARAILADLADTASDSQPYGLLLRNEARRTAHRPASYILGEFLVPNNTPCYFSEFAARAEAHALAYVCEADLEASVSAAFVPATQAKIRANAGDDPMAMEQYIDYFSGRTFRCSVLARAGAGVRRARHYDALRHLHISSELRRDGDGFKDAHGRVVQSGEPMVVRALERLASAFPDTVSFAQLAGGPLDEASSARLCRSLAAMVVSGRAEASTLPLRVGRADGEFPTVWAPARAEAAARQPWITSLAHAPVALKPAVAALIGYCDGSNGVDALKEIFAAALRNGEVQAPERGDESLETVAADYVQRVLAFLAANALLEDKAPAAQ
jgi:trans-aconitate methyltransferase